MSSTVIEKVEPVDDPLEIVIRERSTSVRQIKRDLLVVAAPWLLTISYGVLRILIPTLSSSYLNLVLLVGSSLISIGYFFLLFFRLGRIEHLSIDPKSLVFSSKLNTRTIEVATVSEINIEAPTTISDADSLLLKINLTSGKRELVYLDAGELIRSRQIDSLFDKLQSLGVPVNNRYRALHLLRLRSCAGHAVEQSSMTDALGEERLRIKVYEGTDRADRFSLTPNQSISIGALAFVLVVISPIFHWHSSAIYLPVLCLYLCFQFLLKPLWLVVGTKGVGMWTDGKFAYGLPFKDLQSVRFTDSRINREEGLMKASIRLRNGEELRFELKPNKPEDRETLRQIAQEFKELKHGD